MFHLTLYDGAAAAEPRRTTRTRASAFNLIWPPVLFVFFVFFCFSIQTWDNFGILRVLEQSVGRTHVASRRSGVAKTLM
jgi:hypothetical protein